MTPISSSVAFIVHYNGMLTTDSGATYPYAVRPVVYLDSSVYKISGDGSITNPYIIGM